MMAGADFVNVVWKRTEIGVQRGEFSPGRRPGYEEFKKKREGKSRNLVVLYISDSINEPRKSAEPGANGRAAIIENGHEGLCVAATPGAVFPLSPLATTSGI
jgi:hypothetical protein